MPQTAKPAYRGLLSRWLPNPVPTPQPLQPSSSRTAWAGLREGARAVLNYEPLRNAAMCNLAKNVWIGASYPSGTSLNTPTEKALMSRYFGGGGGSYRLSPKEWDAAQAYYDTYGKHTLSSEIRFPTKNGGYRQNMNFARIIGDDRLDGLLGTATGHFDRKGRLVGISDIFDFDDKPRGHSANPLAQSLYMLEGKAVGLVQKDADTFCPGGSNPVTITGRKR